MDPGTPADPTSVIERSAQKSLITEIKWLWERFVYYDYYIFECTLKDTLTAKSGDFSSSTPQVRPDLCVIIVQLLSNKKLGLRFEEERSLY